MLKEYIADDNNVFLNADEFCESATLNGASVNVLFDNDRLTQKISKDYAGIIVGDILFFISYSEWQKVSHVDTKPKSQNAILLNNKPCIITDVIDNNGIYEITVQYQGGGR